MLLHANAIAQNRPAGVWTRRVDRNDADGPIFLAIVAGKLIDERALPGARWPSQSEYPRLSAVWKESLEECRPTGSAVLHRANGTRESPRIGGANLINQKLDVLIQTASV
jgi:hypothetical protein